LQHFHVITFVLTGATRSAAITEIVSSVTDGVPANEQQAGQRIAVRRHLDRRR
jgi:hypothetical protein